MDSQTKSFCIWLTEASNQDVENAIILLRQLAFKGTGWGHEEALKLLELTEGNPITEANFKEAAQIALGVKT